MSTLNAQQKVMGRPRVDSEELRVRMQRPELDALDAYCATEGVKGRPEAIRRLIRKALGEL
jgi:metal-responsive CopG/Arc/MetJ family transcriptional regulator